MTNSIIKKTELLGILQENRTKHIDDYQTAMEGYGVELREKAGEMANKVVEWQNLVERELQKPDLEIDFGKLTNELYKCQLATPTKPRSHAKTYDVTIRMLELDTREEIELTLEQFENFVLDEWAWKEAFVNTSNAYAGKAGPRGARG